MNKRRGFRKARDVGDYASLSTKRTIFPAEGGNFAANNMYEMLNVSLDSYPRAVNVAKAYQHFRISKITLTLKPFYDTFQSGVGNVGRPNAYYMIDKSGSLDDPTLETLKQMGAKAHRFDEKPISVSWRPSVLGGDMTAPGVLGSAQYKISPWLSTTANPTLAWAPSTVDHLGIYWYIEQPAGDGQYFAEIEVQFQFKKPFFPKTPSAKPSIGVVAAVEDSSPDGVQGGTDGISVPIIPA